MDYPQNVSKDHIDLGRLRGRKRMRYDYMEVIGTTPGKEDDHTDLGGRAMPGAIAG